MTTAAAGGGGGGRVQMAKGDITIIFVRMMNHIFMILVIHSTTVQHRHGTQYI